MNMKKKEDKMMRQERQMIKKKKEKNKGVNMNTLRFYFLTHLVLMKRS